MSDEHRLEEILSRIENALAERENWQREHSKVCDPEQTTLWLKISFGLTGALWFLVIAAGGYVWNRMDDNTAVLAERGERIGRIEERYLITNGKIDAMLAIQERQANSIEVLGSRLWTHEVEQAKRR